jgi:hypothetical protein
MPIDSSADAINVAHSGSPPEVSIIRRSRPLPTMYVLVPCIVNCNRSSGPELSKIADLTTRVTHFARVLSKYTQDSRCNLFDAHQLRQAGSLTFEVIVERADVQTLVDLAVAALVAVHFEMLRAC